MTTRNEPSSAGFDRKNVCAPLPSARTTPRYRYVCCFGFFLGLVVARVFFLLRGFWILVHELCQDGPVSVHCLLLLASMLSLWVVESSRRSQCQIDRRATCFVLDGKGGIVFVVCAKFKKKKTHDAQKNYFL